MTVLLILSLIFAAVPTALYFKNVKLFRPPPDLTADVPSISVLIPARDEEQSIAACLDAVRESCGIDFEVIVLDDGSTDRTAEFVTAIAANDHRIRLETAPPLPAGWSGKQHACFTLSKLATKPLLCFLDADVRLAPSGLARMAAFQKASGAALVSGFPRQETGTFLEKLLIPLIHFILLGFLPLKKMRESTQPRFGAGCGQWFLTTREAYDLVGGHEAVKASFHDGVKLPRAYRAKGLMTDLCDATSLATCRMYRNTGQVIRGFAKNAREGLGSPIGLWVWTIILVLGQVTPTVLFCMAFYAGEYQSMIMTGIACVVSALPLLDAASRYEQSSVCASLHPFGIITLLGIQWYAAFRHWLGVPVGWKGRLPTSSINIAVSRRLSPPAPPNHDQNES